MITPERFEHAVKFMRGRGYGLMGDDAMIRAFMANDDAFRKAHAEETEDEPLLEKTGFNEKTGEYITMTGHIFTAMHASPETLEAIARHMRYMEKQRAKAVGLEPIKVTDAMCEAAWGKEQWMRNIGYERTRFAIEAALAAKGDK